MALCLMALSLAVLVVSARMRLEAAGIGCADWPACYGKALFGELPARYSGILRIIHRILSTSALLLGCALVWRCLRPQPIQPATRHALLLVLLMLVLAVLGFWSSDPRLVLVGFLNIMGGFGLLTLSWRVFLATAPTPVSDGEKPSGRLLRLGLALLALTLIMGAWLGASYAAVACLTMPHCGGTWWPVREGWAALNPLRTLTSAAQPGDAAGVALHLLHRYLALVTVLILGAACVQATRIEKTKRSAWFVLSLLLLEFALGGLAVRNGLSLWLVMGHGVGTALLLVAVATLMRQR